MNLKYKRLIAFMMDMTLISILTILITSVSFINPYLNDKEEAINAYQESYQNITDIKTEEDMNNYIKDMSGKLYKLEHASFYENVWYLIFFFLYYVVFQYFNKGMTVGKRLMHLKVISSDDKNASFIQMMLRTITNGTTLFYGVNITLFVGIIGMIFIKDHSSYFYYYAFITFISIILEFINIILYLMNKDNKCLNDYISKTKIVEI